MNNQLKFKIATENWEFEQIHELNYNTFVEEIPQHESNPSKTLIDKFHEHNIYIICLDGEELLGMLTVRDRRPFSLDRKLNDLDSYLPDSSSICEIRLLSIKRERRNRKVILGLFQMLAGYCEDRNYDLALISANVKQERLYNNLGFTSFGPRVGTVEAQYQPMYLTPASYTRFKIQSKLISSSKDDNPGEITHVSLLPGPVNVRPEVKEAFEQSPVSHRSEEFVRDVHKVRSRLCSIAGVKYTQIIMGSGSLANDIVAAQLSLLEGRGLVLSNGEFGERLIDHSHRFGLEFETMVLAWGEPFNQSEIEAALSANPDIEWLWAVHAETSTGVLNDISMLHGLCDLNGGLRLCLDCISSIGTVPLNLSNVYLATGVSGKGLASYPGLSFVFYNHVIHSNPTSIPRYLDLGLYAQLDGVPFTVSSNLLYALERATQDFDGALRYKQLRELSGWLRAELQGMGFEMLSSTENSSPALITIALPDHINSRELGGQLDRSRFHLSYMSGYLLQRNLIQIALMGNVSKVKLMPLVYLLQDIAKPKKLAL